MWLLIAFIAVPLIEITLFIEIGGVIGLGWTLAIVLFTAVFGTWLVRTQGAIAFGQVKSSFSDLRDPTEPLVHGAMILVAGILLLTPGFFTDALGFALLVPPIRRFVFRALRTRVSVQGFAAPPNGARQGERPGQGHRPPRPDVIEGEYHEIPDSGDKPKGPSGWTKH